jgi:hypothetical protein
MNTKHGSLALSAGLALGIATIGATAQAADGAASDESAAQPSRTSGQQRVADTTLKLENAFHDQFVRGKIDRSELTGPIADVLSAMPEAARPTLQAHIELVLQAGERLASQMTPEQRTAAAAPPAEEKVGTTEQAQLAGWGWGGAAGFGGFGAFGFPAMGGFGWGGLGFGGLGFGGLGMGRWFW